MLTEYNVLKPDVPRVGWQAEVYEFWREPRRLREMREWEEFFALWREHPRPHDPEWRNRLMSIQCARDGNHWVWGVTRELMQIAAAATAPAMLGMTPPLGMIAGVLALPYIVRYTRELTERIR